LKPFGKSRRLYQVILQGEAFQRFFASLRMTVDTLSESLWAHHHTDLEGEAYPTVVTGLQ